LLLTGCRRIGKHSAISSEPGLRGELTAAGAEELLCSQESPAVWSESDINEVVLSSEPGLRGELPAAGAEELLCRPRISSSLERKRHK
jgi:hypothetical protein